MNGNLNKEIYKNKVMGCIMGGAIGDALGYPVEFNKNLKEKEVTELNDEGYISDDTQMTLFTANAIIWSKTRSSMRGISMAPEHALHLGYLDWLETQTKQKSEVKISWIKDIKELNITRAPGNTCISALSSGKMGTLERPINSSKGCGGVMRIAPIGLVLYSGEEAGFNSAKASAITHGHPLGIIPAYFLGALIYYLSHEEIKLMDAINKTMDLYDKRFNIYDQEYKKYFIILIYKAIELSQTDISDQDAIKELGEGWVAEEALAIAIYSSLKYQNNFKDAIVCAVNHIGDSDSTGSITGNIMGAYLGYDSIPKEYITKIELRDVIIELATDLASEVPISEFSTNNDEYWESKYIDCKRVLSKK